jgi:hypothetical protein
MKQATPLTILLILALTTLLSYTIREKSNVSNTVIPQTQKGDSSAWYQGDSHPKPTMYTKYNALNLTNYKISIQAKADHVQTNETKQTQEKIYSVYVMNINTINIVTKKEVCVTPLPISLYQNMDTIHNATAEHLRKDPVNDQALVKFKNQVITMNGNTKTAKEYSLFE